MDTASMLGLRALHLHSSAAKAVLPREGHCTAGGTRSEGLIPQVFQHFV